MMGVKFLSESFKHASSSVDLSRALLVLIALLGFFLRIFHLDAHSLWLDEALTVAISSESPYEIDDCGLFFAQSRSRRRNW